MVSRDKSKQNDSNISAKQVASGLFKTKIANLIELKAGVTEVLIDLPEGLDYQAGQYLEILLPNGAYCPFSFASGPKQTASTGKIQLHIKLDPDSYFYDQLIQVLVIGNPIQIRAPKGVVSLDDILNRSYVQLYLIMASTGFTQAKSMIEQLVSYANVAKQVPSVHLYWGGKSLEDLYYLEEIQALISSNPLYDFIQVIPVISDQVPSHWQGATGFVHTACIHDLSTSDDTNLQKRGFVIAGSPNMVYAVTDDLLEGYALLENMHSDVYDYAPRDIKNCQ